MEDLNLYELTIDDINFDGVSAISLVDFPAIEQNFLLLNKQKSKVLKFTESIIKEKNIITGPALIPDKKIFRFDIYKGEYDVFFSADTVKKISEKFIEKNKDNVTVDHLYGANNINLIESWIIEDSDNDKANALGFSELPKGTWMVSYKILNKPILEQINNGELKGFSIEGYVTTNLVEQLESDENLLNNIEKIITDEKITDEEKYEIIQKMVENIKV